MLFSILIVILYYRLRPSPTPQQAREQAPAVFRNFTPPELLAYNGSSGGPVYLAVRGQVFDVSSGRNFYGPGGPYVNFAGRDASRGLACGSFDKDMLTTDLTGELDNLRGLDQDQLEALADWEARFRDKYLLVGRLVACRESSS